MNNLYKDIRYVGGEITLSYTLKTKPSDRQRITTAVEATELIRQMYDDDIYFIEKGYALMMDGKHRCIGIVHCGTGNHNQCFIDHRKICQAAILCNASAVILFHNHPSGSLTTSRQDDTITKDLHTILKTLGIVFMDHIIITSEDYYSYQENGKL